MSRNVRVLQCTPEDVFEVLADGWLYPSWVVGASRMREVDETWPMAGAELHHSVGVWPVLIDDKTVVEQFVPSRLLVMRARGWPLGEARVTIEVKLRDDRSIVRIQEEATAGPARLVPRQIMDVLLYWRNAETLHRLAYLAEGRAQGRTPLSTAQREMSADTADSADDADTVDGVEQMDADRPAPTGDDTSIASPDPGRIDIEANENPLSAASQTAPAADEGDGGDDAEPTAS